jgi:quercetin dioxygenase-like cupin family protein
VPSVTLGIDVFDAPAGDPTSSAAMRFFAEQLGVASEEVRTFEFRAEPGDRDAPHTHTSTLIAWFTSGAMEFLVGPELAERVEVGAGRCIRVGAGAPHGEGVVGPDPVRAVIAFAEDFDVVPLQEA